MKGKKPRPINAETVAAGVALVARASWELGAGQRAAADPTLEACSAAHRRNQVQKITVFYTGIATSSRAGRRLSTLITFLASPGCYGAANGRGGVCPRKVTSYRVSDLDIPMQARALHRAGQLVRAH